MTDSNLKSLLGTGLYTIPEIAALSKVPASSVRRWLFGYSYRKDGEQIEKRPVLNASSGETYSSRVASFADLIEIQFIWEFRRHGVSWNVIRIATEKAKELTNRDHPFASREFVTDGKTIFAEIVAATNERELLDLRSDQMAFRKILLPSLIKKLDLDQDKAIRYWPGGKSRSVVLDPQRQFGQPIIEKFGVQTALLATAYKAFGSSFDKVASWYDVAPAAVRSAVAFERELRAA